MKGGDRYWSEERERAYERLEMIAKTRREKRALAMMDGTWIAWQWLVARRPGEPVPVLPVIADGLLVGHYHAPGVFVPLESGWEEAAADTPGRLTEKHERTCQQPDLERHRPRAPRPRPWRCRDRPGRHGGTMKEEPAFPDCAYPDDCECLKRGYLHETGHCLAPGLA